MCNPGVYLIPTPRGAPEEQTILAAGAEALWSCTNEYPIVYWHEAPHASQLAVRYAVLFRSLVNWAGDDQDEALAEISRLITDPAGESWSNVPLREQFEAAQAAMRALAAHDPLGALAGQHPRIALWLRKEQQAGRPVTVLFEDAPWESYRAEVTASLNRELLDVHLRQGDMSKAFQTYILSHLGRAASNEARSISLADRIAGSDHSALHIVPRQCLQELYLRPALIERGVACEVAEETSYDQYADYRYVRAVRQNATGAPLWQTTAGKQLLVSSLMSDVLADRGAPAEDLQRTAQLPLPALCAWVEDMSRHRGDPYDKALALVRSV